MKERPILMNAEMVCAVLNGSKTQTRRVIKPQPKMVTDKRTELWQGNPATLFQLLEQTGKHCPFGQVGDRLWVRESWQYYGWSDVGEPQIRFAADTATKWPFVNDEKWSEKLVDIWEILSRDENYKIDGHARDRKWRPSLHMPRWACRLVLEIVSVRVERLQDISEADALAEGIFSAEEWDDEGKTHGFDWRDSRTNTDLVYSKASEAFSALWQSIYGAESWDSNPWVWVVEFKKL